MPGVQTRDVFLSGEFAHVLESVGTDGKYLAPLSDQDDRVVVVEYASQNRHVGLQRVGFE